MTHTAREGILNYLTGRALCSTPRPPAEAEGLVNAHRAEVLREAADFVGNNDDCDCGGCDTCIPRKLAAELRRMASEAVPATDLTIYRASHDSIVMGIYTTATEARAHCVAEERRTWAKSENPVFDWIEDEEDGVAELVTVSEDGETETVTGYVVTALTVASAYDPEADQ